MDNSTVPQVQIPSEIRSFLGGLLEEAGMTSLEGELKEEMINQLYERLNNFITSTIVDRLPPENIDEFIRMNEENRPQNEIEQYLKDKLPGSQDIFGQAFVQFRDIYLGKVTPGGNQLPAN